MDRRDFLHGAAAGAAALAIGRRTPLFSASPKDDVIAKIAGQHDADREDAAGLDRAPVDRRREPQLSAGRRSTWRSSRATPASSASTSCRPTGKPGVFATLDAGAATTGSASTSCTTSSSSIRRSGARRRSRRGSSTSRASAR